jgi:uncharacterized membrane protein
MTIVIILFYLLFPALLIYFGTKYPFINKIGVVVFCYVGGLIIGNINIIPDGMNEMQGTLQGAVVLLGIPLVLFSENIVRWVKMAKTTFLSLILGLVSVVIMVIVGYYLVGDKIDSLLTEPGDASWKVAGLLIGVYTGGQPNLGAIGQALNVSESLYLQTIAVDLALGALLLLFLLTGAKRFFSLFLKPFKSKGEYKDQEGEVIVSEFESYEGFFKKRNFHDVLKALGIAVLVLAAGFSMTMIFKGDSGDTAAVLAVTTLGLLLSLVKRVNKIRNSFQLGMYFIYMFCVILASQANIVEILNPESWELLMYMLIYVAMAMFGALFLHAILSWIFKVNTDEFIMTSTALSNSPPFVPVIAAALKNKEVMIPGMIVGVIGYALGNYLGVAIAYLLR